MPRILLLLPTTTYRTKAFVDAALKLNVDVTAASEHPSTLSQQNPSTLLTLNLFDPDEAAAQAVAFDSEYPIDAVIPVDEDTAVAAAHISEALNLRQNPVRAAAAAKNKALMREVLREAGVQVPKHLKFSLDDDLNSVAGSVTYPGVVKPVYLSTSRGVMRVDNREEFLTAVKRLEKIITEKEVARRGGVTARNVLFEEFVPGVEVALEGLVTDGELRVLAIFDKPDPLDGPFFEETIYVTPSRLTPEIQQSIVSVTQDAISAMGLLRGPVHAELRVNERGPWVIEVAARAIGGLCSRTLRFGEQHSSLEEVILRHALGLDVSLLNRESVAAGVMMIPVPASGILEAVHGVEEARQVDGIEDVIISAHVSQKVAPPPEGSSYLGFIFSRRPTAVEAESALRKAHAMLRIMVAPD